MTRAAVDFADSFEPLVQLLDELPVAACLIGGAAPYVIVHANGAFGALVRRPAEDTIGTPALDLMTTDLTTTVDRVRNPMLEGGPESWAGRVRVAQVDGEAVCLVAARRMTIAHDPFHLLTLIDAGPLLPGGSTAAGGELRSAAFQSAPTAIGIFDLAGNFLDCNDAMVEFFGHPRAALLGMSRTSLRAGAPSALGPELSAALIAGAVEALSFEEVYVHADGRRLEALTSVAIRFGAGGDAEYFVAEITPRHVIGTPIAAPVVVLDRDRAEDLARSAGLRSARERLVRQYGLSEREETLLELLMRGRRVSSIADEMFLASGTVRNNLSVLYHRLGVAGRAELLEMVHDLAERGPDGSST